MPPRIVFDAEITKMNISYVIIERHNFINVMKQINYCTNSRYSPRDPSLRSAPILSMRFFEVYLDSNHGNPRF